MELLWSLLVFIVIVNIHVIISWVHINNLVCLRCCWTSAHWSSQAGVVDCPLHLRSAGHRRWWTPVTGCHGRNGCCPLTFCWKQTWGNRHVTCDESACKIDFYCPKAQPYCITQWPIVWCCWSTPVTQLLLHQAILAFIFWHVICFANTHHQHSK